MDLVWNSIYSHAVLGLALSSEILQFLQLEPHNEGADPIMLDCGVSWLPHGQKSCGSPQTANTTFTFCGLST